MKRKPLVRKLKPVALNCPFCKGKINPDYKQFDILKGYLTERGKILGKDRTGLCSKHQRRIAKEIKKARLLALLPFSVQVR